MSNRTSLFFDAEAVRDAVATSGTQSEALVKLRQVPHADNYRRLQEACVRYGLAVPGRAKASASKGDPKPRRESRIANEKLLRVASSGAHSRREILIRLGVADATNNYSRLEKEARLLGIVLPARKTTGPSRGVPGARAKRQQDVRDWAEARFAEHIANSDSLGSALAKLNLLHSRENAKWLRELCTERGLKAPVNRGGGSAMPDEEWFALGRRRRNSESRARIERSHLIPHSDCASCGSGKVWNGKPLTLHLDHVNGDTTDNRVENLRFLCPNCHSQTPTYCLPKQRRPATV